MSLILTTFPSGASINAATMMARINQVEAYVNEGIVAADRGAAWMVANHIYRPDFFGGSNPHTTFTSGEAYFSKRSNADSDRAIFSYYLGTGPYPVPGLCTTVQIPESLSQGTVYYRLVVMASFYVFEWGGAREVGGVVANYGMDESSIPAASVALYVNGSQQNGAFTVYKGSRTGGAAVGSSDPINAFFPRKQFSFVYAFAGTSSPLVVGLNNISVQVSPMRPTIDNPSQTKHIIFSQGNLTARYWLR